MGETKAHLAAVLPENEAGKPTFESLSAGFDFAIIFNSLGVGFDREGPETFATKVAAFSIPISVPDPTGPSNFIQTITYGVVKTAGSRAVLFADVNGTARSVEFPYGMETNGAILILDLPKCVTPGRSGPAFVSPVTIMLTVLIERSTPKDTVILQVDGIDISAVFGPNQQIKPMQRKRRSRVDYRR